MKRRFFALFAALVLTLALCAAPAWADGGSFVYGFEGHDYDWVTESDMLAQEIMDDYALAVCYAHEETLSGMTPEELARTVYDENAPARNGIILADCDDADEYCIYRSGTAVGLISDEDAQTLINAYAAGGSTYADALGAYYLAAREIAARVTNAGAAGTVTLPDGSVIPAERQLPRVVDNAAILDAETLNRLIEKADAVSEKYQCDVAVVLTDGTDGKSTEDYAFDFYETNGYGYGDNDDGVMLAVDVTGRTYCCITRGFGAYAFTDAGQEYADEYYVPYLRDSDWEGAAEGFIAAADTLLAAARSGQPYGADNMPDEPPGIIMLLIDIVIGLLLAFIPIGIMRAKLKSVDASRDAQSYVRPGSFRLTRSDDRFVRRYITKTPIPRSNDDDNDSGGGTSFTTSSSGRSYGSHGGSF